MRRQPLLRRTFVTLCAFAALVVPAWLGQAHAQRARATLTLNFWTPLSDPIGRSNLIPYLHKFELSHPGITVRFVPVSADNNWIKYTTAMVAGRGPDVALVYYNPPVPEWAANGLIQPLEPWLKLLHVSQDQWLPWVWKMQSFHGHVWTFVQEYDTNVLIWNKDSFKAAGLDPNKPPRTIAELDADARKLTKIDAQGNLIQAGFVPWLWSGAIGSIPDLRFWSAMFGGRMYDETTHLYTVNTPANVASLAWEATYAKLLGGPEKINGFLGKFTGNADPFYTGKLAMKIVGEWNPNVNIKETGPKNLHFGVAAPPTAPGVPYGTNIVMGSDAFVLPAGVPHPEESAELMLYMMSSDPVLGWCYNEANIPPTRKDIFNPNFVQRVPAVASVVQTAREAFNNPRILVPFPSSSIFDYANSQFTNTEQQVLFGRLTPGAAMAALQKQIDQHLAAVKRGNPDWYATGD